MIRSLQAEAVRLGRPKLWIITGALTAAYAAIATAIAIGTAEPAGSATPDALPLQAFAGPGGGTAAITWVAGFAGIFVLATFIANVAGDFSRGTFRAALLQQPNRLSLLTGKLTALLAMVAALLGLAMATGWAAAAVVAPGEDLSTSGWFGLDAFAEAAGDYGRVIAYAAGWAVLGTLIAVVFRSVPIGLAVGIVWAGPIENVIGDSWDPAASWFPGLLLRSLIGSNPEGVGAGRAGLTLAAYGVIALAIIWYAVTHSDVTS